MITMKDIIRDGHPTLREVAEEVAMPASDEDKKTLNSLLEYIKMSQDPEMAEKGKVKASKYIKGGKT